MKREEAIKFWKFRYENAKDYTDPHWEAQERREHREYVEALRMAIDALQTEAVQGEWIDEDGNKVPLDKDGYPLGSCWCNQCHEWLVGSDEYAIKGNFCPNCGAKMLREDD